jgi:hypothetical protein
VVLPQGLNKLEMDLSEIQMREPDMLILKDFAKHNSQPQLIPIKTQRLFRVLDNNRNVIQFA